MINRINNKRKIGELETKQQTHLSDYKIVEGQQYEQEFTCMICTNLVTDPIIHKCHKMFCKGCYDKCIGSCPNCRGCKASNTTFLNQFTIDAMSSIKLQCDECKKSNIPLTQWKKHCSDECGSRCVNKPCNVKTSNQQLHNETCSHFTVKCPYKYCNWVGERRSMHKHLYEDCIYQRAGDFDHKVQAAITERDSRREGIAMKHNTCATVGLFDTIRNSEVAGLCKVLIEDGIYNETSEEFKFTINGRTKKVKKGDARLVHLVTGFEQARQWEDLECKLFWIRNRIRPDHRELVDPAAEEGDVIELDSSQDSDASVDFVVMDSIISV
jgi:hypothetical protein